MAKGSYNTFPLWAEVLIQVYVEIKYIYLQGSANICNTNDYIHH